MVDVRNPAWWVCVTALVGGLVGIFATSQPGGVKAALAGVIAIAVLGYCIQRAAEAIAAGMIRSSAAAAANIAQSLAGQITSDEAAPSWAADLVSQYMGPGNAVMDVTKNGTSIYTDKAEPDPAEYGIALAWPITEAGAADA